MTLRGSFVQGKGEEARARGKRRAGAHNASLWIERLTRQSLIEQSARDEPRRCRIASQQTIGEIKERWVAKVGCSCAAKRAIEKVRIV
jgi:hypothetical protein